MQPSVVSDDQPRINPPADPPAHEQNRKTTRTTAHRGGVRRSPVRAASPRRRAVPRERHPRSASPAGWSTTRRGGPTSLRGSWCTCASADRTPTRLRAWHARTTRWARSRPRRRGIVMGPVRWLVVAVLAGHGLIHLLGVVKASGWAEVSQLRQPIGPGAGVVWLLAAVLVLASAVLIAAGAPTWWWTVAVLAAVVSEVAIATAWSDAKFGTAANLMLRRSPLPTASPPWGRPASTPSFATKPSKRRRTPSQRRGRW